MSMQVYLFRRVLRRQLKKKRLQKYPSARGSVWKGADNPLTGKYMKIKNIPYQKYHEQKSNVLVCIT
jgi:hypothetical protein